MTPMASSSAMAALTGFESWRKRVSLGSATTSPRTGTATVWLV